MATPLQNQPMYCLRPSFLGVLSLVGASEQILTLKQITDYLKNYICLKKLFDPKDPRRIHCENDELGSVFGVSEFTVNEAVKLVQANVTIVDNRKPTETSSCSFTSATTVDCKRKCPDASCNCDASKRFKHGEASTSTPRPPSPMFLQIPSTPPYASSSETDLSVQGYETEFVKDSSDDEFSEGELEVEVQETGEFSIEYEVESASSVGSLVSDTDSDVEDIAVHALLFCQDDSDKNFWADNSSDELTDSSDPELSEGDKWECSKCQSLNSPLPRFCQVCWEQRLGWLPERHIRHPPQRHRSRKFRSSQPFPSDQSSQLSSLPSSQESLPSTAEQQPSASPLDSLLGMCMICMQRGKTATIIHGKTGHQVCCYPCARQLQDKHQPCPVCRRTIQKVVRNFIV